MMRVLLRYGWWVVFLAPVLVAAVLAPPAQANPTNRPRLAQGSCPDGELSQDPRVFDVNSAFDTVITPTNLFGGYSYTLTQALDNAPNVSGPPGSLLPVLAESVAGIESDWQQFRGSPPLTTRGIINPCDYGIMQINHNVYASLFNLNPSLLSRTEGNIAAGDRVLADKWHAGTTPSSSLEAV